MRNLADPKGLAICEPPAGGLLAIYAEEPAGWLQVEVPGGFLGWVFGRYLEETETPGLYRVTKNAVNVRPLPSSNVQSFPLPQRLHAGDPVQVDHRESDATPLEETWVAIWTPPGVRGFVRAEDVQRVELADGEARWTSELERVRAARPVAATPNRNGGPATNDAAATPANAVKPGSEAGASRLSQLRTELERELGQLNPDYARFQAAFGELVRSEADGLVKEEATRELDRVNALAEAAALESELERLRSERSQDTARTQSEIWEAGRRFDPLRGAFEMHGVLVRRVEADGTPRYTIESRRQAVAELFCTSGRYDLDTFAGFEIGILGKELKLEASSNPDGLPVFDASKIQVLKRR